MTTADLLDSISIVLVKTSHPGNVGSTARAMKTMGLSRLILVKPVDDAVCRHPDAIALASGAADILDKALVVNDLTEALDGVQLSFALSARIRELGPTLQSPFEATQECRPLANSGVKTAFVFGTERTGLTNDELLHCNRQVFIPSNPDYCSLNLSQAVQIITYSLRLTLIDGWRPSQDDSPTRVTEPVGAVADAQAVERLKNHWLEAMAKVDFLNPGKPKKLIPRLSRLLGRAGLEQTEVDMLRGFLSDVIRVAEGRLYAHEKKGGPNASDISKE